MSHTRTRTYAILRLSFEAFNEIRTKLEAAGYDHLISEDSMIECDGLAFDIPRIFYCEPHGYGLCEEHREDCALARKADGRQLFKSSKQQCNLVTKWPRKNSKPICTVCVSNLKPKPEAGAVINVLDRCSARHPKFNEQCILTGGDCPAGQHVCEVNGPNGSRLEAWCSVTGAMKTLDARRIESVRVDDDGTPVLRFKR